MYRFLLTALALCATSAAHAIPLVPGFASTSLPRNDDGSSAAIPIGFTVNFMGQSFSSLYVNNNGNITFGQAFPGYGSVPLSDFTQIYYPPMIAPFWSDVDTRHPGSGLTSWGTGTYKGFQAFGATWQNVTRYTSNNFSYTATNANTNSFQVILVNRSDTFAGNFDVYLNYERLTWDTGTFMINNPATAGYNSLSTYGGILPSYYEFPGSGIAGAMLDGGPNSLVASHSNYVENFVPQRTPDGQRLLRIWFPVSAEPTFTPVSEPASLGILALAGAALLRSRRSRHSTATP